MENYSNQSNPNLIELGIYPGLIKHETSKYKKDKIKLFSEVEKQVQILVKEFLESLTIELNDNSRTIDNKLSWQNTRLKILLRRTQNAIL